MAACKIWIELVGIFLQHFGCGKVCHMKLAGQLKKWFQQNHLQEINENIGVIDEEVHETI